MFGRTSTAPHTLKVRFCIKLMILPLKMMDFVTVHDDVLTNAQRSGGYDADEIRKAHWTNQHVNRCDLRLSLLFYDCSTTALRLFSVCFGAETRLLCLWRSSLPRSMLIVVTKASGRLASA